VIGYVTIGVSDMEKGKAFWTELLEPLGAKMILDLDRIALIGTAMNQPMLAVCVPWDEDDPQPGNGNMVAFPAGSREKVDEMYARDGGYFRDPDDNKAVFYHMG